MAVFEVDFHYRTHPRLRHAFRPEPGQKLCLFRQRPVDFLRPSPHHHCVQDIRGTASFIGQNVAVIALLSLVVASISTAKRSSFRNDMCCPSKRSPSMSLRAFFVMQSPL